MALKIWSLTTCDFANISNQGSTDLWAQSGGTIYYYKGTTLRACPLCVYYGGTKLTKVTTEAGLSSLNTWYWGDLDTLLKDTVYVNVNSNIDLPASEIVQISTMSTVIPSASTKDRIIINARISNNSDEIITVRTALYDNQDTYVANILPVLTVPVGKLVDDNSRVAVPIGYKYKVEASSTDVSILVSGDEY